MEKGKCASIGFAILESHLQIKENSKASTRCDGSFSLFISTKNAGFHWIAFGQKLSHKEWSLICNKILLWRSVLVT